LLLIITSLFTFNFITYSKTPDIKWEQYSDFEALQKAKQIEVFAPSDLPKGYLLQKIEYQHEIIKGTYLNGKQTLIFVQTLTPNGAMNMEATWKNIENETILSWSTTKISFEIKSTNLKKEDLNSFKQSLRSISNTTDIITLPFETITSNQQLQLDKNNPKSRKFSLFTPQTFREFAKKQHVVIDKNWQASDDEIIIGLFAGEKGSSGYAINTSQVALQNNQLTVMFHEIEPTPNMAYLTVMTYPFQFISVKIPPGNNVSAVQFVTGKGEALANLVVNEVAKP
jgi:hypothetical protein